MINTKHELILIIANSNVRKSFNNIYKVIWQINK